jgi:AcrR family transcriptional regulator
MSDARLHDFVEAQVENPDLIDKRRGQIVTAAIKLFGARGYYTVTIKDIAKEAGISPGLIYQYFKNKEDVLLLVLLERLDQYARDVVAAAETQRRPLARLYAAFSAYCGVVDDNKEATILAYRSFRSLDSDRRKHVLKRERDIHALLAGYVEDCLTAGQMRDIDVDLVCSQIATLAHAWALQSWRFDQHYDLNGYVRASFDLLVNGVLTGAGRRSATKLQIP